MRIHILTFGTRGDVQPMVALGLGLRHAGHSVRVVASPSFEQLIRCHGLDFAAMRDEGRLLPDKNEAKTWAGPGKSVLTEVYETQLRMWEDSWAACQDAEAQADRAALRIRSSVVDLLQPGLLARSQAHRARLERDNELAAFEPPALELARCWIGWPSWARARRRSRR